MKPRIVYKPAFTVVGLSRPAALLNGNFEALWEELGDCYAEIPHADPDAGFGVHTRDDGGHNYLAGLAVRQGGAVPRGMAERRLGGHAYAVFVHTGLIAGLADTVDGIFTRWLPGSGYHWVGDFYFEYYDDRFQPGSPDSMLFLWVPVMPKG